MGDTRIALAGLDWFAALGAPPELIDAARREISSADSGTKLADDDAQTSTLDGDSQAAELLEITIEPSPAQIPGGGKLQLAATGEYSDGTTRVITTEVEWASSEAAIRIDAKGQASADAVTAEATITATDKATGVAGEAQASVAGPAPGPSLVSITVTPANPAVPAPAYWTDTVAPVQFQAMGVFADKSSKDVTRRVIWKSSNPNVVAVDVNGLGAVTAPGTAIISASDMASAAKGAGIGGQTTVTATEQKPQSVVIAPASTSMDVGEKRSFRATLVYSGTTKRDLNEHDKPAWSATGGLYLDEKGEGAARQPGPASVSVRDPGSGLGATLQLTIVGVRSMTTPGGPISYFVGQESTVKPLITKAAAAFTNAEALDTAMDESFSDLIEKEKGVGPLEAVLKEVKQFTGPRTKRDAADSVTAEILDDGMTTFHNVFGDLLTAAKKKVKQAEARLARAETSELILIAQKYAQAMDSEIDELAGVAKVGLAAPTAAENPAGLLTALVDLGAAWMKADNPFRQEVQELSQENADSEYSSAVEELKDARDSVRKQEPRLLKVAADAKKATENAANHWGIAEQGYDTDKDNKGNFRFKHLQEAIPAAQAASKAALAASSAGYASLGAARALAQPDKAATEWMADVAADKKAIIYLLAQSKQMYEDALNKKSDADGMLKRFQETYEKARDAMAHAPAPE